MSLFRSSMVPCIRLRDLVADLDSCFRLKCSIYSLMSQSHPAQGGGRPASRLPVTGLMQLLSDPTRLRILLALREKEHTVKELQEKFRVPQPTVSHHLATLRGGDLVSVRRSGKNSIYSLAVAVRGRALEFETDEGSVVVDFGE